MSRKILAAWIVVAALFFGCTDKSEQSGATEQAPDFTLQDLSGNTLRLSDFKGKVVLIDFWATYCPPCRAAIPGIQRLYKTYGGQGLVVLGVSFDTGAWDSVKAFQTEYGITYPILKGTDSVGDQYMVRTIPMMVVIDKEGNIRQRFLGFGVEEQLEKEVKALL